MKTFLVLSLLISGAIHAQTEGTPFDYKDEKFKECLSPDCITVLCEQGEIVEKKEIMPVIGCTKAMRKNKDGKFTLEYYEIGIKEIAFKPKEAGGTDKKPVGILFRFR